MPESNERPAEYTGKHKRPKRVTENADFIAMFQRMIRTLEARAVSDPSILAEILMLAQRLDQVPNVVIARSATQHAMDPMRAPSLNELAAVLGIKRQSAQDRRKVGDRILFERAMGEDTVPQRERRARTLARKHAEATMADWLARKDEATR
jgi:hypothetical protein